MTEIEKQQRQELGVGGGGVGGEGERTRERDQRQRQRKAYRASQAELEGHGGSILRFVNVKKDENTARMAMALDIYRNEAF